MPIFKSRNPPIDLPRNLTTWEWLFESPASPLVKNAEHQLAGFTDAATKQRVNWKDIKEHTIHISTALKRRYGMLEGQTVSLFSQNTIMYPVMLHSVIRAGGKVSGASPAYGVEEMTYALKTADAKFLTTSPSYMDVAERAAKQAGIPKEHIFLLEGSLPGYTTIEDLIGIGKSYGEDGQVPAYTIPAGKSNHDICGFLSFSSGTTGLPKAVMISHQNIIAQCLQIAAITPLTHRKVLLVLPAFHITGLVHAMNLPILLNAEVIMLPAFDMRTFLQTAVDYQIEELLLVPPIVIRLVRDPIVDDFDLSCVKRFSSGAAPLSEEILQLLAKKFPGTGFKQGYGMTESTSCITAHPPEYYGFEYAHTVGTIVADTEVKIIKDDGTEADVGEPGEILGRGPAITMGYLNRPDATRETFDKDGWLHTGDQGKIDESGLITITDRIKELIKVKGTGVAPAELEDLLLGHPEVEDVAVLAITDDYSGERPKAYVVSKPAVKADEELGRRILAHVRENKVRHKWLLEVEFIEAIPKSASGKILRRELRDKEKRSELGLRVRDAGKVETTLKAKL